MKVTTYLCKSCRTVVREPGQMQRSWCSHCEDYVPVVVITQVREADHKVMVP